MSRISRGRQPDRGDQELELGFGSVVSQDAGRRLLNRDGTFNVHRKGLGFWESIPLYHLLLEMTWPRFVGLVGVFYLALNLAFAFAYTALGPDAVLGGSDVTFGDRLTEAFFFSVQTSATLGYGGLTPNGIAANLLVTVESMAGLLSFGLVSGLMFARFARPTARVMFSEIAVVAPYEDVTAFEFRLINLRKTQISDLVIRVIFVCRQENGKGREYRELDLERARVAFFPLAWTVVHPIRSGSPLHGMSAAELEECDAEFLILLQGFDDTFSQTVHSRSSYRADEVVFGARFGSVFDAEAAASGDIVVDVGKLHDIESAPLRGLRE
jgi:inward rectifier potassium channel